jgi:pimeloyl-ACP methyl ester carboxylesterase
VKINRRDGVRLAHEDTREGSWPILFIHGWGCDHSFFAPQVEFFRTRHRVVAVDLRGHGSSDAPQQDYTVAGFAEDLAWLCTELNLSKPVLVGHSMGGTIALEFAARYPELLTAAVLIDSVILPPPAFVEAWRPFAEALKEPGYVAILKQAVSSLFLPTDDSVRKADIVTLIAKTPQHVLASAFCHHITEYDATTAASGCRAPLAYIGSEVAMADLHRFRTLYPQLITAQTLGSGHFSTLGVPDQINAMLARFFGMRADLN